MSITGWVEFNLFNQFEHLILHVCLTYVPFLQEDDLTGFFLALIRDFLLSLFNGINLTFYFNNSMAFARASRTDNPSRGPEIEVIQPFKSMLGMVKGQVL